jgi:hypothetical protein
MQVGDLIKYCSDVYVTNRTCDRLTSYGIIKEVKNNMALVFWHKNQPFTFSDRRERQSWVEINILTKISET